MGNALIKHIRGIQIAQKKCVQAIFGAKFNAPSSPIFKQLGILKFLDIYELNYSTKETHIWLPWHIISILGIITHIIWYQTVPWSIGNRMMATINVSLNYPRYQSRTSTGGVSCQKLQFLYFYGRHQKKMCAHFGGGIMVWGGMTTHGKIWWSLTAT